MREYNWMGFSEIRSTKGKLRRLINQFTPFSWTKYKWEMFSSFSRLVHVVFAMSMYLVIKANSFFVKFVLYIPPLSMFNTLRLLMIWLVALPAFREYYEYTINPLCTRIGPHSWLVIAATAMEVPCAVLSSVVLIRFE